MNTVGTGCWSIVKGFLLGVAIVGVVVALLLVTINAATAQESVATYPATMGEQDRRLVTEQPSYGSPSHVGQYEAALAIWDTERTVASRMACKEQNLYLYYLLVDLAKSLSKHPKLGYMYTDAIQGIHDAWCRS